MFTGDVAGKAKEAIDLYTSLFPGSSIDLLSHYEEGEGDNTAYLKHARFTLAGDQFIAMDSSLDHTFTFNEAFSLLASCDTQEEIDAYWEKLSAVPEAEQCGWLKDRFGVSWQISPSEIQEMMASGDTEKIARVTKAFLEMKKFDIAALRKAYEGE
jgi:predicted 3-demethylubiquinone-9 3-methyltransferase (glyoxalase superfamily)